jgi:hypothetical protein
LRPKKEKHELLLLLCFGGFVPSRRPRDDEEPPFSCLRPRLISLHCLFSLSLSFSHDGSETPPVVLN